MPTVRLIVRYDGTGLSGWQRQRAVPTVQEHLETAASAMALERVRVHGAGRTDAGVHAFAQVASFVTNASIPEHGWRLGLNSKLPRQIAVRDARFVPEGFDPRRAAGGKRYRYLYLLAPDRDPFLRDRAMHVYLGTVDVDRMAEEAKDLVGAHDFRAFRAADCERATTVRHVFRAEIVRRWLGDDALVALELEGTGFLKNMVRIIAGTLLEVGRGRLPPGTVRARFADGDRTKSGVTAPPQGLYLDEVFLKREYLLPGDVLRPRPAYADAMLRAAGVEVPDATEDDE